MPDIYFLILTAADAQALIKKDTGITLKQYFEPIQPTWIDHYGHLNEAYYLVAFSNATWPLQSHIGVGKTYYNETGCALYTVESHLCYLKEIRAPALLCVNSMILGAKDKKLWIGHELEVDGVKRATCESILIHFDTTIKKATSMPLHIQANISKEVVETHPKWVGREVSLEKKK